MRLIPESNLSVDHYNMLSRCPSKPHVLPPLFFLCLLSIHWSVQTFFKICIQPLMFCSIHFKNKVVSSAYSEVLCSCLCIVMPSIYFFDLIYIYIYILYWLEARLQKWIHIYWHFHEHANISYTYTLSGRLVLPVIQSINRNMQLEDWKL